MGKIITVKSGYEMDWGSFGSTQDRFVGNDTSLNHISQTAMTRFYHLALSRKEKEGMIE